LLIKPLPLLNFFVAVVMFSIGLRTSGGELLNILRDRALFARSLLANCILNTRNRLSPRSRLPAEPRRKYRHIIVGCNSRNANRLAIYSHGQD
jgi:hypothetical protein